MAKINKMTAGIVLAAAVGGGAVGAAALPAMADSSTASSTATYAQGGYGDAGGSGGGNSGGPRGQHQANGKTEEILTGDTAAKVEAAVKAAQPGATIERMETDADGATYEAHIIKADGTRATVLLDANFAVTGTEEGIGGPGGRSGPRGSGDATANS
jgi:Spy/CpxP family protein refolding chaperone